MKQQWFWLVLALGVSAQAAPIAGNTLSGKITDWPAGKTGEVQLGVAYSAQNSADHLSTVLATAPVDENGNFSLKLPAAAAVAAVLPKIDTKYLFQNSCKGELKLAAPAQVNFFELNAYADFLSLGTLNWRTTVLRKPKPGDSAGLIAFASAPAQLTGQVACNPTGWQTVAQSWDTKLAAGWNVLAAVAGTPKDKTVPLSVGTANLPDKAFWHIYYAYSGVGLTSAGETIGPSPTGRFAVVSVDAGGPADKAGLRPGDVFVSVDGFTQGLPDCGCDIADVSSRLGGEPGTPVVIVVKRGAETLTFTVVRQLIRE